MNHLTYKDGMLVQKVDNNLCGMKEVSYKLNDDDIMFPIADTEKDEVLSIVIIPAKQVKYVNEKIAINLNALSSVLHFVDLFLGFPEIIKILIEGFLEISEVDDDGFPTIVNLQEEAEAILKEASDEQ